MKAGRELDGLIAEKVMDIKVGFKNGEPGKLDQTMITLQESVHGIPAPWRPLPFFSSEIAAAWLVVEKLKEKKLYVSISITRFGPDKAYEASFSNQIGARMYSEYSDNPAHAICLAALKAVEGK